MNHSCKNLTKLRLGNWMIVSLQQSNRLRRFLLCTILNFFKNSEQFEVEFTCILNFENKCGRFLLLIDNGVSSRCDFGCLKWPCHSLEFVSKSQPLNIRGWHEIKILISACFTMPVHCGNFDVNVALLMATLPRLAYQCTCYVGSRLGLESIQHKSTWMYNLHHRFSLCCIMLEWITFKVLFGVCIPAWTIFDLLFRCFHHVCDIQTVQCLQF